MEKQLREHIDYNAVSKNEAILLGLIKNNDFLVFGVRELRALTNWSNNRINNTLSSLEKKGILLHIKRDNYTLEANIVERSFEIATETIIPSYISFWSALSFYGLTEQQVSEIQLISTKQYRDLKLGPYMVSITTFKPNMFYGYRKRNGFVIAEIEKALVDSLYLIEKCGGLTEFIKCLVHSWKDINQTKLLKYALKFNNKSLISRLGYLIEHLELETNILDKLLLFVSKSYIKLSVIGERNKNYNKKWNVMVNHDFELEEIM